MEAWVELAQILEQSDILGSLAAYAKAMDLMRNSNNNYIPPEILNNVAALNYRLEINYSNQIIVQVVILFYYYRLGNLDESRSKLEESLSLSKKMVEANPQHYNSIAVTTTYNLARIFEAQCQFQKAETFYKDILKEHPNYIDCMLN